MNKLKSRKLWVTVFTLANLFLSNLPTGKLTLMTLAAAAYVTAQAYVDGK